MAVRTLVVRAGVMGVTGAGVVVTGRLGAAFTGGANWSSARETVGVVGRAVCSSLRRLAAALVCAPARNSALARVNCAICSCWRASCLLRSSTSADGRASGTRVPSQARVWAASDVTCASRCASRVRCASMVFCILTISSDRSENSGAARSCAFCGRVCIFCICASRAWARCSVAACLLFSSLFCETILAICRRRRRLSLKGSRLASVRMAARMSSVWRFKLASKVSALCWAVTACCFSCVSCATCNCRLWSAAGLAAAPAAVGAAPCSRLTCCASVRFWVSMSVSFRCNAAEPDEPPRCSSISCCLSLTVCSASF